MAIFYNPNRKKGLYYIPSGATGGSVSAPLSIEYSANAFCENGIDPIPTVSNNVGAGTFSSTTGLVFVSTSTGEVDLSASTTGATYLITYTDTNAATAEFSLTVNALDNAAFAYSQSSYAPTDADPTPTVTLAGGTFSAGSGLVFVDSGSNTGSSTGQIDLSASTIASYTITYTTAGTCPNTSTQTVEIAAALAQVNNVYSMEFDGVDDYIDLGDFTSLLGTTNKFSTSLWCNWQGGTVSRNGMLNFAPAAQGGGGTTFDMRFENTSLIKISIDNTATRTFTVSPSLSSAWVHIAFTYDGTLVSGNTFDGVKLYINGAEANTLVAFAGINPTINFASMFGFLGFAQNFSENRKWDGLIDEVGIFNSTLTAQEVQAIYNATETGKTADLNDLTTPPVAWYRM